MKTDIIIQEIDNREKWNSFVFQNTKETFHQSWEWGELYKAQNHQIWRFGIYKSDTLIGCALTIKVVAKRGSFLLIPHGPILSNEGFTRETLRAFQSHLSRLATKNNCGFVRVSPITTRTPKNTDLFHKAGFQDAPIFVQSEQSWVLSLEPSDEELLKNMRKSTRYILKREEQYGVTCTRKINEKDFTVFYDLYKQTVASQGFWGQSEVFMKDEFLQFLHAGDGTGASLYFAEYKGKPIATALVIEQNGVGFYHYGASARQSGNYIPAPQILQWFIIKDLKTRGFSAYNFWGIAPEDKPNHPWVGLSRFKKGFGGEAHEYVKTLDAIVSPLYWINWIVETVRKYRRGY